MTEDRTHGFDRRRFIRMTGLLGGSAVLAGCAESDEPAENGEETDGDGGDGGSGDGDGDGGDQDEERMGGTFFNTTSEDADTLDPRMSELAWFNSLAHYMFDGLLMTSPDGSEFVPHLAKELPEQVDDTTYVFQLREGVSFHDGEELTAEDVAWTFNWVLDPDNASVDRPAIEFIDNVEATGEYEATFTLKHPFALFQQTLAGMNASVLPKHVASEVGPEEFGQNPVGSGPFKFVEWESASHVTLERHDDYFLKTPNIEELTYRIIPEQQVQWVELASGNVHQASIPKDLIGEAETEQNVEMNRIAHFDYNGLIFNAQREPFDRVEAREAMQYLVDYDQMLDAAKGELGSRAYGFMPLEVNEAWEFPYQEWNEKYYPDKDHDRALELLDEAGVGTDFELEILTLSVGGKFKNMAIILQNELNEIGVEAEVRELDIGGWLDSLNRDSYDVNIYGWGGGQDPDGFYYYLFRNLENDEGGVDEEFFGNSSAGMLYQAYPDDQELAEADEKIREARTLSDREARRELYIELAETFQSRYPHIPVYSELDAVGWRSEVQDYELTAFSAQPLCNHWSNAYFE
jgi:peptide/nickel transport system substrate-binding protein